jgi:hypothetical protein
MGFSEGSLSLFIIWQTLTALGVRLLLRTLQMCPIPVDGFLGFPYLFAFAKLRVMLVCVANQIFENLDFPVYFCKLVCVLVIVHDASPQTRILRLFHRPLRG